MDVGRIDRELAEVWRQSADGEQPVVRACTHNLIVACQDREDAAEASNAVAALSESHPGRAIVLVPGNAGSSGLDAWVSTHCHRGAAGARVCCEQITLETSPGAEALVPGTVLQLLAGDLPVYVWWRRSLALADPTLRPLASLADRFVVNSARHRDPGRALAMLHALAREKRDPGAVGDLTWVRLENWRDLIASLFDGPLGAAELGRVTSLEIAAGGASSPHGTTAAAAYLAGWLASRLGWTAESGGRALRRTDGGAVTAALTADPAVEAGRVSRVALAARDAIPPARFVAERLSPGDHAIRLEVVRGGACPLPRLERLVPPDDAMLLAGELERDAADPLFEAALESALRLF